MVTVLTRLLGLMHSDTRRLLAIKLDGLSYRPDKPECRLQVAIQLSYTAIGLTDGFTEQSAAGNGLPVVPTPEVCLYVAAHSKVGGGYSLYH